MSLSKKNDEKEYDDMYALIKLMVRGHDKLDATTKELVEKYFNYRILFDLGERSKLKLENLKMLKKDDELYVRATTPGGKTKRMCQYGENCFRKNREHLSDFLHYTDRGLQKIATYKGSIKMLLEHQKLYRDITSNMTPNRLNMIIIERAKIFTDAVLSLYRTLDTDTFTTTMYILSEFEQPINTETNILDYGLECPGFAILMTFIYNIENEEYRQETYSGLFSLLDQIPISGSYKKTEIERLFPRVYSVYMRSINPVQGNYIRNDPIISNNTMMDFLANIEDMSSRHPSRKRQRTMKDASGIKRGRKEKLKSTRKHKNKDKHKHKHKDKK